MKISNFKLEKTTGRNAIDFVYFATIDVEDGFLWWKKKRKVEIRREYCGFWHFVETGKYVPDDIRALARAWTAKTGEAT